MWQYRIVKGGKLLTAEAENALIKEYKDTHSIAVRNKIIESNYRLILDLVLRYEKIYAHGSKDDMVGEGVLGMIRALDKFNLSAGNRFSTYATYWINCALYAYIKRNSRIVSVTEYANVYLLKFKKSKDHEQLKQEWGINKYSQIKDLSEISSCDLSLNKHIKDPASVTIDSERSGIREFIDVVIKKFSAKEKAIIRLRYGLNHGERKTLKEIGDWFGISQERVRQIERKVLKKIRSHFEKRGINHLEDLETQ